MFVELKRFFEGHSELEAAFFLTSIARPESDIAAFSLFLAIRASLIHQEYTRALRSIDMLLSQLPAEASREDREFLLWLKSECERKISQPPAQT